MKRYPRKVYAIQHNITKRIYIGSTTDLDKRYRCHILDLRSGRHKVPDLQEDFINFGEDFSVFVLDEIKDFDERLKEYEWIKKCKTYDRNIGYNYKDHGFKKWINRVPVPLKEGMPEVLGEKHGNPKNTI